MGDGLKSVATHLGFLHVMAGVTGLSFVVPALPFFELPSALTFALRGHCLARFHASRPRVLAGLGRRVSVGVFQEGPAVAAGIGGNDVVPMKKPRTACAPSLVRSGQGRFWPAQSSDSKRCLRRRSSVTMLARLPR